MAIIKRFTIGGFHRWLHEGYIASFSLFLPLLIRIGKQITDGEIRDRAENSSNA